MHADDGLILTWRGANMTSQLIIEYLVKVIYRKISNIRPTLVGNKIVDNSDVVGASPVGAAPTTSSFSTQHLASMDWAKTTTRRNEKHLRFGIWCICIRDLMVISTIINGQVLWRKKAES